MGTVRAALNIWAARISLPIATLGFMLVSCGPQPIQHGAARPAAFASAADERDQLLQLLEVRTPAPSNPAAVPAAAPASPPQQCTPVATTAVHPVPAPVRNELVTVSPSAQGSTLRLLSLDGTTLATASINPSPSWLVAAGGGRAFWGEGGVVHELDAHGTVRTAGPIASNAEGLVAAPDGASYAYSTADALADGGMHNRIVVVHVGGSTQVIADRVSDPNHPACDAPQLWQYYLIRWTGQGILFARTPAGGCGCGPFDMEMQSESAALIDPATLAVTALPASGSCPLSAFASSGFTTCFERDETGSGATEVRVMNGPNTVSSLGLSGKNAAGNAQFSPDGSQLAYLTVDASSGCGSEAPYSLHVLDLHTSAVRATTLGQATLSDWASTGALLATVASSTSTAVVSIDPVTLARTALWTGPSGSWIVGLA